MKTKISKLVNVYKKYGFIIFIKKLYAYIVANYLDKVSLRVFLCKSFYRKKINKILTSNHYDRIILWRSSFGYNVPLFQRPQHIANNLTKNNTLMFYEVTTMTDKVKIFKNLKKNLYLFNFNNIALKNILMKELEKIDKPKYIQLYSTDWKLSVQDINNYINSGYGFIYEYIDHLSPELAGTKDLPQNIIDKYEYVMTHDNVYIVVTASELEKDVISRRGKKRLIYSSNGVDYDFFKKLDDYQLEDEYLDIINNGKINVCYYGALATWFDYDLIKKIAATDKYNVLLFGIKYDSSYNDNLTDETNIYFMGPRDYKVLKYYAAKCDVMTIPFKLNDITKATSPVKLFEYMAMHKPIVTTDLQECRKYKSILIGKNHEDFINKLHDAYMLRDDKNYKKLLDSEAIANDWSKKAETIINKISKDEKTK